MSDTAPRIVDGTETDDMPRPHAAMELLYELAQRRQRRLAALRGDVVSGDNKPS